MQEISYINYSSTVRNNRKGGGVKGFLYFLLNLMPILIFSGIFVSAALIHLYVRNQILRYSYEIPIENKTQRMLLDENKALKSQLSMLISPVKIEKYAIEKLRMRYPEPEEIIEISSKSEKKDDGYIGFTR